MSNGGPSGLLDALKKKNADTLAEQTAVGAQAGPLPGAPRIPETAKWNMFYNDPATRAWAPASPAKEEA